MSGKDYRPTRRLAGRIPGDTSDAMRSRSPGTRYSRPGSLLLLALLSVPLVLGLSGCLKHRSTGSLIDDNTMELRVIDALDDSERFGPESHIKVEVIEGIVLLMGETDTEERRAEAGRIAADVHRVERVVNEIELTEAAGLGTRMNNTWLSSKVKTALITKNPIEGFDGTRIKVVTSDRTVFLMGRVTREEGNAVAEVARNVSGVEKVVKVFDYKSD